LGDPNTELVDFDKGGFKILRFNNLEKKLSKIDLTATYISSKKRPEISIHDVNDPKKELISIRCKVENKDNGPYVRNYIEKGKLLEEITKVQYQAWDELEKPDPSKVRLQIKNPKSRTPRSDNIGRSKR
jgi:DNA repair exonuclease SbcCD nuclease subunit